MRKLTTFLILLFVFAHAAPAHAQLNFVERFLQRYRPSPAELPARAGEGSQQALPGLIRTGALQLTVSDVIDLMLDNNLDIGVNRISPRSSHYLIDTLYRPFEPTLRISTTITRDSAPSTTQLAGAASLRQLRGQYSVNFTQTLPTGTDIGASVSLNRNSTNSTFNTLNPSYTGLIRYQFNQHLLRNFGVFNNSRQIRVARNNQKISEFQFERQLIDLVTQAQQLYWDLVFTAEDLKVKQRSMELAQKTLSDNQIQVEIGTLAPIDVVQAETEVAARREQLIISSYTQSQSEDKIKKVITSQGDPGLVLARIAPMESARRPNPSDVLSAEAAIQIALENRPEMKQLDLEIQNRDYDARYAKNQLLPNLDVFGSYIQNGAGGRRLARGGLGGTDLIIVGQNGIGGAFNQLFGGDFTGYSVGFSLEIPLSNKAARAEEARAQSEKRLVQDRRSATAQQIALEVRNALTVVEMNRARIEAAEKTRELTERRLDAEQTKFQLGSSTIRFVLEEQRNVTQAQTNEIAALVNYTKALVDLDRAMGMTLQKKNIEIDKTLNPPVAAR